MADLSTSEIRTEFEEQKRVASELHERLGDVEYQINEGEKLRKKLHNTILVKFDLCCLMIVMKQNMSSLFLPQENHLVKHCFNTKRKTASTTCLTILSIKFSCYVYGRQGTKL